MIYIKTYFGWHATTPEHAIRFCNNLLINDMSDIPKEERIPTLNKHHLRGIKYEELVKMVSDNVKQNNS